MTYHEFNVWCSYRHKYGPLNPVRMYDQGAALIASQISNTNGMKTKPIDFMPYGKSENTDTEVDEDQFIAALMATGKAKLGR